LPGAILAIPLTLVVLRLTRDVGAENEISTEAGPPAG
jgi:predicted PurR-regulated permease PerM